MLLSQKDAREAENSMYISHLMFGRQSWVCSIAFYTMTLLVLDAEVEVEVNIFVQFKQEQAKIRQHGALHTTGHTYSHT